MTADSNPARMAYLAGANDAQSGKPIPLLNPDQPSLTELTKMLGWLDAQLASLSPPKSSSAE